MPKLRNQRIAATRELGADDWLSLLPVLTIPARLNQLVQAVIQDDVVTAPQLVALALEAGTDPDAIHFVRTLHRHPLVKMGDRVVSVYPDAHAHPQAVRQSLPLLAIEAGERLTLTAWWPHWLDEAALNALIAAGNRGVQVELELLVTPERPLPPLLLTRLKAARIRVKTRRQGSGPEKWRVRLPGVAIDGTPQAVY